MLNSIAILAISIALAAVTFVLHATIQDRNFWYKFANQLLDERTERIKKDLER